MNGRSFVLTEDEVSIGRGASNQICINDTSLSRRHCLIKRDGETFRVIDLESSNGTFINARPIGEQCLNNGDQITVGSVLLLFIADEVEVAERRSAVEFSDDDVVRHATIRLERKDAIYFKPGVAVARPSNEARIARDLEALLKISTSLSKLRELTALQRVLLETVLNAVPAERGAILLVKENSEELLASYGRDKRSQTELPVAHQPLSSRKECCQ